MPTFEQMPILLAELKEKMELLTAKVLTPSAPEPEPPINVKQAAEFIGCAEQHLYRMVHKNEIPFHKKRGRLYFFKSELISWIKEK